MTNPAKRKNKVGFHIIYKILIYISVSESDLLSYDQKKECVSKDPKDISKII